MAGEGKVSDRLLQFYQSLIKAVDRSGIGLALTDAADRFIYVNDSHARVYGRSREDILGKTWRDLVPPETIAANEEAGRRRFARGEVYHVETPGFRGDGTVGYHQVAAVPLFEAGGAYAGHVCIVQDISAQKEAERQRQTAHQGLEKAYAELALLFDIAFTAGCSADLDQVLHRALTRALEVTGARTGAIYLYDPQKKKLVFKDGAGAHPGPAEAVPELEPDRGLTSKVFQTGRAVCYPDYAKFEGALPQLLPYLSGHSILVAPIVCGAEVVGTIPLARPLPGTFSERECQLLEAAGNLIGTAIENARLSQAAEECRARLRLTEGTERARAYQFLQESFNYKQAVLGSLAEAVLSLDLEGSIIYANPAASRIFGYQTEELERMRLSDLYAQAAESRLLIKRLEGTQAPLREDEAEFRTGSGQVICGRQTLSPLRDHQGALIGAVLVVDDISGMRRLEGQAAYLAEKVDEISGHDLVGVSQAMREVMRQAELVARTDSSVLILGETGTGKELVARAIHEMSPRRTRPMVKVHCAALSPGLIESEFFGHEKGAFTGATSRKVGRFELADGGTIFLDEVGDVPLETQVKLLRVLQEREFERVGGTRTIRVDVRVVAATNRDMQAAVDAGTFRPDLYYRLNVFPIRVPALRERVEAIPVLAAHFAYDYAKTMDKRIEGISPETIRRLKAYPWPGNVRELRNVIERAVITSPGPVISLTHIGLEPAKALAAAGAPPLHLAGAERNHILQVLEMTSWQIAGKGGAAALLQIKPSTLRSRMKKLGISRPST